MGSKSFPLLVVLGRIRRKLLASRGVQGKKRTQHPLMDNYSKLTIFDLLNSGNKVIRIMYQVAGYDQHCLKC